MAKTASSTEDPSISAAEQESKTAQAGGKDHPAGDLASELGTLTYAKAVERFGRSGAVKAMQDIAALGGHGMFDEAELTSPLFGGLIMPSADSIRPPQKESFAKLADGDFRYDLAMEDHKAAQAKAVADREKINDYLAKASKA